MGKTVVTIDFGRHNYSDGAVDQVVESAPGRPFHDEHAKRIGTVEKATRIDGTKTVEFEIDLT